MKGLILKDLYNLSSSLKIYVLFYLFYGFMAVSQGQTALLYSLIYITGVMLPLSAISYNERSNWDRLVNTMPVTRKQIVYSIYILAAILLASSSLISGGTLFLQKNIDRKEVLAGLTAIIILSLFYQSVIIPVVLVLGGEKGRLVVMTATLLPVVIFGIIAESGIVSSAAIVSFAADKGILIAAVIAAVLAVCYRLSVFFSVRYYSKKDL